MDSATNELIEEFVAQGGDAHDWRPSYLIAPPTSSFSSRSDAVTGEVIRSVDEAVWDFHPSFMKDSKRPQFNARLETVATNGLWKGALSSSHCIVPMRRYYEWEDVEANGKKAKQPHFVHGNGTLAAGIYTARKVNDTWQLSTAIITRAARDASGEVHDRMPVFLTLGVFDEWLAPTKLSAIEERETVVAKLEEVSGEVASTITTYEVDRRVNNSRTASPEDATLIEPVRG